MKKVWLSIAVVTWLSSCNKDEDDSLEIPTYGSWTVGNNSFTATSVYRSDTARVITAADAQGNTVNISFVKLPKESNTFSIVQSPDTSWEMAIHVVMSGSGASYYTRGDDGVDGSVTINYENKLSISFPEVKAVRFGGGDSLLISGNIIEW